MIDDETPLSEIKVKRICAICSFMSFAPPLTLDDPPLVSPAGVVHHGRDYGMTLCGKDATGSYWWWKL